MKVGIVGLPNAGKSSLFNALTAAGAEAAAYPFTTVEPNRAVLEVPDPRLERLADALGIERRVHDVIEFVDVAGLVPGAHSGEGLGNRFLAQIRETDAILHVVRCFCDAQVGHPQGRLDPGADIGLIEAELVLADLESVERRLERAVRTAKSGDRTAQAEEAWLQEVAAALGAGRPAASVPVPEPAAGPAAELFLLTSKPVLYVANVDAERCAEPVTSACPAVAERAASAGEEAVAVSAAIEAELAELPTDEAAAIRADLGLAASGIERVVAGAFGLLDLITFFTVEGGREARAWSIPRGTPALAAAGRIHTDMEEGFVRCEVLPFQVLVEAGSFAAAREHGSVRVEGRDYEVHDGEVLAVRHTS